MGNFEYGTTLQNEKYSVRITTAHTYIEESADNRSYDYILNPNKLGRNNMYRTLCISVTGTKNAEIALVGDYYTSDIDCAILEDNILTVLQNDYISQIDLETVQIIAGYELDVLGTTFSIYRMSDGYLIYGEIEIIKFDNEFNVAWKFSGRDIFVSITDKNAFELTDRSIKLYDFEDNFYEIDFNGNLIREELKG
jgi:hypothetical protein